MCVLACAGTVRYGVFKSFLRKYMQSDIHLRVLTGAARDQGPRPISPPRHRNLHQITHKNDLQSSLLFSR